MPTYEYACRACEERLEVVQSFRDDPLTECPSCGGQLRKVFQPVGIAFKGSGFYKTDSRSSTSTSSGSSSSSGDGASSGSGDSSTKSESTSSSTPSTASSAATSSSSSSSGTSSSATT